MEKTNRLGSINDLVAFRDLLKKREVLSPGKKRIASCCGLPCSTLGSHKVVEALEKEVVKDFVRRVHFSILNHMVTSIREYFQKKQKISFQRHSQPGTLSGDSSIGIPY